MTLLFVLLFLIYPSVCSAIFSTFQCKTLGDGTRKLRVDLLIDCDSAAHQGMTGYAILMVLVYALGAPLLYAYLLFGRFGKTLRRLRDIEAQRVSLDRHAKDTDRYNRFDKDKGELEALTSTTSDSVQEELLALKTEEDSLRAELPAYIRSLSGNGYGTRHRGSNPLGTVPSAKRRSCRFEGSDIQPPRLSISPALDAPQPSAPSTLRSSSACASSRSSACPSSSRAARPTRRCTRWPSPSSPLAPTPW